MAGVAFIKNTGYFFMILGLITLFITNGLFYTIISILEIIVGIFFWTVGD